MVVLAIIIALLVWLERRFGIHPSLAISIFLGLLLFVWACMTVFEHEQRAKQARAGEAERPVWSAALEERRSEYHRRLHELDEQGLPGDEYLRRVEDLDREYEDALRL